MFMQPFSSSACGDRGQAAGYKQPVAGPEDPEHARAALHERAAAAHSEVATDHLSLLSSAWLQTSVLLPLAGCKPLTSCL